MIACGLRRRLGRVDTDWVRAYAGFAGALA